MPININKDLPAATTLAQEGIFVMTDERASTQDIRPLKIAILNLMPTKAVSYTHLQTDMRSTTVHKNAATFLIFLIPPLAFTSSIC